jgi:hypothetical protein
VAKEQVAARQLIDDRELQDWDEDRFRHSDVALQLAELAATVKTPANVGLYGAWGSGKTGIANLLRSQLRDPSFRAKYGDIQFARFDAFKYAEVPLRRHFLSQMAVQLLPEKQANSFRRDLYHAQTRADIDLRSVDAMRALKAAFSFLSLGVVLVAILSALLAGAERIVSERDPDFWMQTRTYFDAVMSFVFAPVVLLGGALVGGLFAIAGKTLPVTRHQDVPSTDEQFEQKFRELLEGIGAERLVVFVDELDRCQPHRVVDVLDTVRTFLDVEKTVFIVAADQQVLERALTQRVKQTTAADASNPYYSSGSEYLDKVFHYQLNVPPLLPARITRYAVELVRGRPGIWSHPHINGPWAISVLIPTHVRSPRRVKTLLNNYVQAFWLATRRFEEGHLSSDPVDRFLELAKLVCLRTEFPLFARELTVSHRLPELFLMLSENRDSSRPPEVSEEAWQKALDFAEGALTTDEMLIDDSDRSEDRATAGDDDEHEPVSASREPRAALRQQLHHYLLKTRRIPDPARDLVFLEGQGYLFNLDESLVEQIYRAAAEGREDDVIGIVNEQDETGQTSIVRLLAQRTREAFPGVEGQNLVGTLLVVAGSRTDEVIGPCADEAVDAVNAHSDHGDLREEHLPGALLLGLRSRRAGSEELVSHVLRQEAVLSDPELGRMIISHAEELGIRHIDRIGDISALQLLNPVEASAAVATIAHLVNRSDVLSHTLPRLEERLDTAAEDRDEEESGPTEADCATAIERALAKAIELKAPDITGTLSLAAFQADYEQYWISAGPSLSEVGEGPLAREIYLRVLERASSVEPATATEWLRSLPDGFAILEEAQIHLTALAQMLWEHRHLLGDQYVSHDEDFLTTLREFRRVQGDKAASRRPDWVEALDADLGEAPLNIRRAPQAESAWGHLRRFAEESLVPKDMAASAIASRLVTVLDGQPQPPQLINDGEYRTFVDRWCLWAGENCQVDSVTRLVTAISECVWLPTPDKENLALRVAYGAREADVEVASPYDVTVVEELANVHGEAFAEGASAWIRGFTTDAGQVFRVSESFLQSGAYGRITEAVQSVSRRLSSAERLQLAGQEMSSSENRRISLDFLRDIEFHDADDLRGADLIVAAYKASAKNNDRRRDLLDAWIVLSPTSTTARQRLISEVALKSLDAGGKQALELIKARMLLLRDPTGQKRIVKDALRRAAGGAGKDRRLEELMREHEIIRKRKRFGGLLGEQEVDED